RVLGPLRKLTPFAPDTRASPIGVGVKVLVGVSVLVAVLVGVGVLVIVGVCVAVLVIVGVSVGVQVGGRLTCTTTSAAVGVRLGRIASVGSSIMVESGWQAAKAIVM